MMRTRLAMLRGTVAGSINTRVINKSGRFFAAKIVQVAPIEWPMPEMGDWYRCSMNAIKSSA